MESIRSIADLVNDQAMNLFLNELAAKIIDGLNRLFMKYDKGAAERWVWELLQNAKDSSIGQDKVKVEIILTDTYVEFKHSGKPFTIKDLQSLIHQTSQKERISGSTSTPQQQTQGIQAKRQADSLFEAECEKIIDGPVPENTGKFGTGFLTTHLLSRIVEISGIYQNAFDSQKYHQFSITLDRSSEEKDIIIQKYKAAFTRLKSFDDEQVCPTVDNFIPGVNCDSSFKYILEDERGQKTAARGIANFYKCISHVLTFNPKFESIVVRDERTNREKLDVDDLQGEFLFRVIEKTTLNAKIDLIKIENGKNGSIEHILIATENRNLQICLPISEKFRVLKRPEDQPTLFVDYPLVGSHTFAYPCVINSHIFLPDEERSSVILEHSRLSTLNKAILKRATTLYHTLIHFICKSKNPIFKSKTSGMIMSGTIPSGVEEQWYLKNFLNPTIQSICSLNIVKTISGHKLPLYEVIIPEITHAASYDGYGRQKMTMEEEKLKALWEILNAFHQKSESQISSLIRYEVKDIQKWFRVLSNPNWLSQLKLKNPDWCFQTLIKVIDCIEKSPTLQHLTDELQMDEQQATDLINLVLLFIEKHCLDSFKDQILKNRRILFNQKGVFVKTKDLFIDDRIDEGYKNLLVKQKYDIRHELLHKNIKSQMLNNYLQSRSMYYIFNLITQRLNMTGNDFYNEKQRNRIQVRSAYGGLVNQEAPSNPKVDLNVLDSESQFKLVLDLLKMIPEETDEEKKKKIQPQENQFEIDQMKKNNKEEEKISYHEHRMKFLKWAQNLKQLQNLGLQQGHNIVKVKDEEMFKISESIVISKVYEVIYQAKTFNTLKASIQQIDDGFSWLEYFYEQFNEKKQSNYQLRQKISNREINPLFLQLDQNLNFNQNNVLSLRLDVIDKDQKLAANSQNLIERLINLHQILKNKTQQDKQRQQPQYSLKSTLLYQRFNKYFDTLSQFNLWDLCKDTDTMLRELSKSSEFIQDNKQHVFEMDKLTSSLFKIEKNKIGGFGQSFAEEYFPQFMMHKESLIAQVMSGELSESINSFYQNGMIDMVKELGGMTKQKQQQVSSLVESLNNPQNVDQHQMLEKLLKDPNYAKKLMDLEKIAAAEQQKQQQQQQIAPIIKQQQEPNPKQFFAQYNIQNDSQLASVLSDLKSNQSFNMFSDAFFENMKAAGNREAYEYVQKIMGYALQTIKEYLMKHEKYDTTNWQPSGHDLNIINGVLKEGKQIIILIRPTDGNKIIFHLESEKNALTSDESELWGCDEHRAPELITFGKVLKWNNINQINLSHQHMFM